MQDAYDWYESRQVGLGEKLFSVLDIHFEIICKTPERYAQIFKSKRAVFIQEFPYQIIYAIHDINIIVYSIFHTKRNPKICKKR